MYYFYCYCYLQITRGEVAETDGRLRVGQRILEVNGFSLLGASHVEAVRALRNIKDTATLLVCDGYCFDDFIKRKTYHVINM